MANEETLLDVLLDRLAESRLSVEQQTLVWAAFAGADQLRQALEGAIDLPRGPAPAAEAESDRPHTYLQAITVRGFRGVGPQASLRLTPGPGLTLVVGRNGSGKSSFAEAVEVALTGTSYRWKDKTKDWKGGWRNLHQTAETSLELELIVDGDRGPTVVHRTWSGDDVDQSECWIQRPGKPKAPLSVLGWDAALTTYRPFLSYSELGQTISGRPSEMYDALASILGLDRIGDAELRLNEVRKALDAVAKDTERDLRPLLSELKELEDDRARAVHAALAGTRRDLERAADIATGTSAGIDDGEINLLRMTLSLPAPDWEGIHGLAADLRSAAEAASAVRGSMADDSRHTAELLERALEHRARHAEERSCPVCGSRDVLDEAWETETRDRVDRLRLAARAAEVAVARLTDAMTAAKDCLSGPPGWLPADSALGAAWAAWASGAAIDDPLQLADHLDRGLPAFAEAYEKARQEAEQRYAQMEDRWRPAARKLAAWVDRAHVAERQQGVRNDVRKATDWFRDVGLDLRNDRLRPLATRSSQIWQQLRQESNVELGPIVLAGKATSRRVVLDVTVDGTDGTALGVMSQGELHALALSLFLPRVTIAESPFGFVVIDDPVQSMDPAKVDGLARVLAETSAERQVVVFTHDTRLPDAVRRLDLKATIWEVVRRENSVVELRKADDPAERALDDARALILTAEVPKAVAARVVPGLCRSALEAVLVEASWRRRLADGIRHGRIGEEIADARGPYELAALAFFGDANRTGDVLSRMNNRYGRWAADTFKTCKAGGHGEYTGDLRILIKDTERLVERIRANI